MAVNERTLKMGSAPIFPLLVSMAIPGLLGTLTTYLYRTVDQIFVGNYVGRNALGGISVLSPFNNVVIALSLFITVGGASLLSLSMGKRDYEAANRLFTNIIVQAVGMALLVSAIFFIWAEPFVEICGAKEGTETFSYAVAYLKIVTLGQVFNMLNQGLAAIIRTEGAARYSMFANVIGAIFNVALDALLIIVFGMGIQGAALATIASQAAGAIFSAAFFLTGKTSLKWVGFRAVSPKLMLYISKMGIAPSIFQMLSFFTNIILNKSLQHYGDLDPVYSLIGGGELCISAVAIVNTADNFITSAAMGINQAVSPLISYNYGAGNYKRVKKASLYSQAMAGVFAILIWGAMMLVPEMVCSLFSKGDTTLISYGAMAMRACKIFALFSGYQMLISMYFSAIGKPHVATFVSISRHGLFLIPALLILPQFMGLKGVLYANSVSDGCSLVVVTIMYIREMRRISKLKEQEIGMKENIETKQELGGKNYGNFEVSK